LLFVKTQVAERVLQKGSRLAAKRKRRLENKLEGSKRQGKRRKQVVGTIVKEAEGRSILGALDSKDDKPESEL